MGGLNSHKKDVLSLSERRFDCENCGFRGDRDLNAAINLVNLAVSSTVSACGLDGVDTTRVKQEVNIKPAIVGLSKFYRTAVS
ncbi:MAG: zinc ribbon domain-containing protein [Jaaginema sp. PMC 1079.18]|nr:zinc ribbon domain-containing protein [Jaaginema sp. PMC 1080.18]MEC4849717.1 zinc ribbon domain-containing protein [Jaaginema sp. PMC 1079.18]MEC4864854.1 zinc ribbon domain-containing protein [Jaaginema sp. PMC 1078.18]